jgi:hypothetical protein
MLLKRFSFKIHFSIFCLQYACKPVCKKIKWEKGSVFYQNCHVFFECILTAFAYNRYRYGSKESEVANLYLD